MTSLASVTLPDNLHWPDEHKWQPVAQQRTRSLQGTTIVEERARTAGRPITLRGAWVSRATVDALKDLEAQAGQTMTLTLPGGATHQVVFRRGDGDTAVDAAPAYPVSPDIEAPHYTLTLRLTEV